MNKNNPNFSPSQYFVSPANSLHKQYLALRAFFVDNMSAAEVADSFNYSVSSVYSLVRDFKKNLLKYPDQDPFFKSVVFGRKPIDPEGSISDLIVSLRKNYLSVPQIKAALDARGTPVSSSFILAILKKEGFARLPRRDKEVLLNTSLELPEKIMAPKAQRLDFSKECFSSEHAGILCFLPFLSKFAIDKAIAVSAYPQTKAINRTSSILCFLALKLSSIKRYSADDIWCMDRGMGLFAGLNVLPKTAWFSSYSSGVTRDMNINFLKTLHSIWQKYDLLSDTVNLDFTSIPYWGDDDHLENNWAGKRNKALASMLALLAQDPDSGIICYGDTTVRHADQNEAVLEFLDFYKANDPGDASLKYLVFDSKATSYQNLDKLNKREINFITIRRRSAKLVERIGKIAKADWKKVRIERANGKGRNVNIYEETAKIKDYEGDLRQIYLTGNGKIKPAIIMTNDFRFSAKDIVMKYGKRWLVEKEISEHIDFFHLNRNSSSMVIKVDFDLTMTIFAHNVYRLFAQGLEGFSHCESLSLFNKFIDNAGEIAIGDAKIEVKLKKKRNLPMLLELLQPLNSHSCSWLNDLKLTFLPSSTT